MKISKGEQDAIRRVVEAGESYGYGNMISHLQAAWKKGVRDKYKFPESNLDEGYTIAMHEDLMLRGFWDETGKSYTGRAVQAVAKRIGDVDSET